MNFSLILPVHNRLEYTKITLKNLSDSMNSVFPHKLSIILVDDGSTDNTSDWVSNTFPEVIILKGDGNLWWSGAVNIGAQFALEKIKADYIILWNNDITIDQNYFSSLIKIVEDKDVPPIIGSKIYVAESRDIIWSMGGFFNALNGRYGMYGYYIKDTAEFNTVKDVDWLPGMGTVILKNVIDKTGYWDSTNFPQYHGDSDFTLRAKKNGFKILVYPELRMYNQVKSSGLEQKENIKQLLKLFTDVKSKCNISKNFKFYHLHTQTYRAYLPLFWFYFKVIGGFIKNKFKELLLGKRN